MANQFTITIEDVEEKKGSTSINIGPLTALNFTATRDALDDLHAAIAAVSLGEVRQTTLSEIIAQSDAAVTDEWARRGNKWLVTCRDTTQFFDVGNTINNPGFGKLFDFTIPCADNALATVGDDEMDLTAGAGLALKTAVEAIVHSPTGGNEVEVIKVRQVNHAG